MITIDQLLESVDLDFEPRWVTKDADGICIFEHKPETYETTREWVAAVPNCRLRSIGKLKLAEFEGKDWTECIYEAPRKSTGKIELLKETTERVMLWKINELVDAVNELKGAKNE